MHLQELDAARSCRQRSKRLTNRLGLFGVADDAIKRLDVDKCFFSHSNSNPQRFHATIVGEQTLAMRLAGLVAGERNLSDATVIAASAFIRSHFHTPHGVMSVPGPEC